MSAQQGDEQAGQAAVPAVQGRVSEGIVLPPAAQLPKDPAEIEKIIAARRERLTATIDELAERLTPQELARRSAAGARTRALAITTTPEGELRTERLAAIGGAAVVVFTFLMMIRRRRNR